MTNLYKFGKSIKRRDLELLPLTFEEYTYARKRIGDIPSNKLKPGMQFERIQSPYTDGQSMVILMKYEIVKNDGKYIKTIHIDDEDDCFNGLFSWSLISSLKNDHSYLITKDL